MTIFRHTPKSFMRALEAGVFGKKKVELLGGVPHVMTSNPPHNHAVDLLARSLRLAFPEDRWKVCTERYTRLGSWLPQPDVAVIRYPIMQYLARQPEPADIRLIAEVSDTSYRVDRGPKYRKYASVGIPEYWIIDLNARVIRVFTDPEGAGKSARYRTEFDYDETRIVPAPADAVEGVVVADVLPPRAETP